MTTEQILSNYKFSHKFLTLFAIATAKYAMSFVKEPDPRSVKAISVAEDYINGYATKQELEEAYTVANANATAYAIAYAAYAANATAYAAYAAYAAANAAAYAIAYAAYAANAANAANAAANAAAYAANANATAYAGDKAYKKAHAKAQDHVRNILLSMINDLTELEKFMLDIPKGLQ